MTDTGHGRRQADRTSSRRPGIPIGPTWHGRFFLGADPNGRDVAVRLLYGGRNSLEIGVVATLITMVLATIVGIVAGYFRGVVDGVLARVLDLIWAYPGGAAGRSRSAPRWRSAGSTSGRFSSRATRCWCPAVIIGVVYIPYVAKPIRGQVLGLREREFVDAARAQGARQRCGSWSSEILPNVASTIIVFVPLIIANAILLEAALSYLGAGVQPPNPSWGTMISDGIRLIPSAIHLTFVPGLDARARRARHQRLRRRRARRARPAREGADRALMAAASSSAGCSRWSLVLFAISVLTFLIFQAIPNGDPALRLAGRLATPRAGRRRCARTWGFDKPIYDQYLTTMEQDLHGHGRSPTRSRSTCCDEIKRDLPATLSLAIGAGHHLARPRHRRSAC